MSQDEREANEFELLTTLDRPVAHSHGRLAALIRGRLGAGDAALLGVPVQDGSGRITGWTSKDGRPLRPLAELPAATRASLQERAAVAIRNIDALADKLDEQGDAGRVAAHMLRSALVTPNGLPALMTDGTDPVLTYWGHARPGQPRPDPLPATMMQTPAGTASAAPMAAAGTRAQAVEAASDGAVPLTPPAEEVSSVAAKRALPLWAWILPLALLGLAGWLGWRAFMPLDPVTVDVVKPGAPAVDPAKAPNERLEALRQALLAAKPVNDQFLAACVAPPPKPVPPPEPPKIEEPPKTEPPKAEPPKEEPPKKEPPKKEPPKVEPKKVEPPKTVPSSKPPKQEPKPQTERPTPPPKVQPAPPPKTSTAAACNPPWKPEDPPRVVFVLDGSGSMEDSLPGGGSKMGAAKSSISTVVDHLHPSIRTGMVSFSDCNATQRTPLYGASQRPTLIGQVRGLRPEGGTSLASSITRAGNAVLSTANLPATIVVVSDGEDTCGRDPCQAAAAIHRAHPNVKINVIDLASDPEGQAALRCVASNGGGRLFTPQSAGQMQVQAQQASGYPDASGCD